MPPQVTINPVVSALAAGNAVVVKPAELAPQSAQVRI
jgi:acyl-CoA reductase-like NAD-dependent aldehyde dehydrogenase